MLVNFSKIPNVAAPAHLAVDPDERVYVLAPSMPNFEKLLEIARQGEAVYPAKHFDDNSFRERAGETAIDSLGHEGTDDRAFIALGKENGLMRATLTIFFMRVSQHASRVDFRSVPQDPESVRRIAPRKIRNAKDYDVALAVAVNNCYETRTGQKDEDTKEFGAGAGRRIISTTATQVDSRFAVVTATPTKLYQNQYARDLSQSDTEHALNYAFFLAKMQRQWKETRSDEFKRRLEWGQVAHQSANGAALGDVKIVNGKLTLNFSYLAGADHKPDYDRGILTMGEHLLPHVPERYKDQVRTVPSFVDIVRPSSAADSSGQIYITDAPHDHGHLRQHHT